MATLAEIAVWEAVYKIMTEDIWKGSDGITDGLANNQAKNLANRTAWLKEQLEAMVDSLGDHEAAEDPHPQYLIEAEANALIAAAVAALVNSSPATLDTLAELATALGNDPNFAATIAAQIGAKAPLASPALTGVPTAPTAEPGTNTDQIATTEFVAEAVGSITARQIQPITASVAANALTLTLNPTSLDFRSATLGSGTVNTRTIAAPISMTVSAGSTLGAINGQTARIAVLAIDNAGTVELACVNLAGGNNLDETTLISTTAEGGAGAADAANVIYSTTARANVPFRVVGYIDITQATAGTWATAPSTIQGAGGQALAALSSLGYGQKWQNVLASRAGGVTYYNTTGRPIAVSAMVNGTNAVTIVFVDGVMVGSPQWGGAPNSSSQSALVIVPPGSSYSVTVSGGSLSMWAELR